MQIGSACFSLLIVVFQAERIFAEVRRIENYRVEGMEIYSTTLWHLQKDVALSVLSKDLTDMDKNSPEVRKSTHFCLGSYLLLTLIKWR